MSARTIDPGSLMSYYQWDSLSREERMERWGESPYRVPGAKHPDLWVLPDPPVPTRLVSIGRNDRMEEVFVAERLTGKSFDPRDSRYATLSTYAKAHLARVENMGAQIRALEAEARFQRAQGNPNYTPPPRAAEVST